MDNFDYTPNPEALEKIYFLMEDDLIYILERVEYSVYDLSIYRKSIRKLSYRCTLIFAADCPFFGHDMMLQFLNDLKECKYQLHYIETKSLKDYVSYIMRSHPSSDSIRYFKDFL